MTSGTTFAPSIDRRWYGDVLLRLPRWSPARQFLVVHFAIVFVGVVLTGALIGNQIETSVLDRTANLRRLRGDQDRHADGLRG